METFANRATALLLVDIDDEQTTLQVDMADASVATAFPPGGNFRILVEDEIIIVGDRAADVFSLLIRGSENTIAAPHVAGVQVAQVLTVGGLFQGITDTVSAGFIMSGAGTPEGVVTASPPMLYHDTNDNELYLKGGGTGDTGWVLVAHAVATSHAGYAGLVFPANDHGQYIQDVIADFVGDLLVAKGAGVVDRLGVGANGTFLTADSSTAEGVKWA